MKTKTNYKERWLRGGNRNKYLILLIIFAFPIGLYIMWQESDWRKWVKIAITGAWGCAVLCALILLAATSLDYDEGSVAINLASENNKILAPLKPENLPETSQLLKSSSETSSLISEPTPTPVPTMVYCNDNGLYYHLAGCRYVYDGKTPRVTLTQALNAGKTACKLCNPPKEETYDN